MESTVILLLNIYANEFYKNSTNSGVARWFEHYHDLNKDTIAEMFDIKKRGSFKAFQDRIRECFQMSILQDENQINCIKNKYKNFKESAV